MKKQLRIGRLIIELTIQLESKYMKQVRKLIRQSFIPEAVSIVKNVTGCDDATAKKIVRDLQNKMLLSNYERDWT